MGGGSSKTTTSPSVTTGSPVTPCCPGDPSAVSTSMVTCGTGCTGPDAAPCSDYYKSVCGGGQWASGGPCDIWAMQFPDAAQPAMVNHCRLNPLSSECRIWSDTSPFALAQHRQAVGDYCSASRLGSEVGCRDMCRKYRGACNTAAQEYCGQADGTMDQGFCSCLRSPVRVGAPECIDGTCYDQGYKMSVDPSPCPSQTICTAYWDLEDIGRSVNIRDVSVVQQCGKRDSTDVTGEGEEGKEEEESSSTTTTADELKQWLEENKALVAIFSIAGLMLILLLLLPGDDDGREE